MKTLNQIILERKKLVRTGYPDSMTDFDYIVCFRKWLQQKETDDFGGEMSASKFKKELLEELDK